MKRTILTIAALAATAICTFAQSSSSDYRTRYENLVKRVGYSGVGVETMLDRWAADYPEDIDMLAGKFNYFLGKSVSTQVVIKSLDRFMGNKPIVAFTDSLGQKQNYFEENFYDDELFAQASQAIDKAIKIEPARLDLRLSKITSLIAYEKESPDMATSALAGLIDYNYASHPSWMYGSEPADNELFESAVQEYCASFYTIGSQASYESFRSISEKMLKYVPKSTMFQTNLGTYAFIVKNDIKSARKYYDKVLKVEPDNYTAIKNSVLMARKEKNFKLEKKYLTMLAKYSPDDMEKQSAQARIDAMNK